MALPALLKFDGVQIGDELKTIGGGWSRNGNVLRTPTLGSRNLSQIDFDSPNILYVCRVQVIIVKNNQWDLEDALWNISDLADSVGDVEVFAEVTQSLKRTYPNYVLESVSWSPGDEATTNRFNANIETVFHGVERPT